MSQDGSLTVRRFLFPSASICPFCPQSVLNLPPRPSICPQSGLNLPQRPSICPHSICPDVL